MIVELFHALWFISGIAFECVWSRVYSIGMERFMVAMYGQSIPSLAVRLVSYAAIYALAYNFGPFFRIIFGFPLLFFAGFLVGILVDPFVFRAFGRKNGSLSST